MLAVAGALALIWRVMDDGGPRAYSRRLRWLNVALTLALGALGGLVVPALPALPRATLGRRISASPAAKSAS